MTAASLAHLRDLCMALPETTEAAAGGDPSFSVRGQTFASGHRMGDRESVWFKATVNTRRRLLGRPEHPRFFAPPYVGQHGWMGAWLDDQCDWSELDDLLRESYRMTAPENLGNDVTTRHSAA
jgi:predicted DNA-binding protein (MmcQ/YjbR family)